MLATTRSPGTTPLAIVRAFVSIIGAVIVAACSKSGPPEETPTSAPGVAFVQAPGSPIELGEAVARPLLADVDGDARLDIVVSYSERVVESSKTRWTGAVAVLLGDGRGGFRIVEPRVRHPMGGLAVAIGDVDGDAKPDLALVAHDSYDVTLLRGDGKGHFADPRIVATGPGTSPHTHSVALADSNADGKLDLIVGHSDDGRVAVLLGDGKAGFAPKEGSPFEAGRHPYEGLAVSDLDRDGDLDVVVPDLKGNALTILLSDGKGGLVRDTSRTFKTGPRPGFLAVGDLDGNGATDVVLTHDDDALLYVFWSDAAAVCSRSTSLRLDTRAWGAVIADFDGDRHDDLALGDHEESVTILFGGDGPFPGRKLRVPAGGRAPGYIAAGDIDGDGDIDLVTGNYETGDVSVLLARRG